MIASDMLEHQLAPSTSDSATILYEGWVEKASEHLGQWRQRWLILFVDKSSGLPVLCTFKDSRHSWPDALPAATQRIMLAGALCQNVGNRFQVQIASGTFFFSTAAEVESAQWAHAVGAAVGDAAARIGRAALENIGGPSHGGMRVLEATETAIHEAATAAVATALAQAERRQEAAVEEASAHAVQAAKAKAAKAVEAALVRARAEDEKRFEAAVATEVAAATAALNSMVADAVAAAVAAEAAAEEAISEATAAKKQAVDAIARAERAEVALAAALVTTV